MVVLIATVWFATAGIRENTAAHYDTDALNLYRAHDFGGAYRQARFAAALKKTNQRMLTLGSLAYLRQDYASAAKAFRDAGNSAEADLGSTASAARLGKTKRLQEAADRLGRPNDQPFRTALAFAYLDAGDISRAGNLIKPDAPDTLETVVVKVETQATTDIPAATDTLAVAQTKHLTVASSSESFRWFFEQLTRTNQDTLTKLTETVGMMERATGRPTRSILLAGQLYRFGKYAAAETLAREAVQQAPQYRDGWNTLAAIELTRGGTKDATRSLKTSLDLDPAFGYSWYLRSQLADQEKDAGNASEYLAKARALGYQP